MPKTIPQSPFVWVRFETSPQSPFCNCLGFLKLKHLCKHRCVNIYSLQVHIILQYHQVDFLVSNSTDSWFVRSCPVTLDSRHNLPSSTRGTAWWSDRLIVRRPGMIIAFSGAPYIGLTYGGYLQSIGSWVMAIDSIVPIHIPYMSNGFSIYFPQLR